MKVAIMTQPLGSNYGGIMQAWALQQVLKRMGHEPVTIDRQPDQVGMVYKATRYAYRASMKALGKRKAPINIEKHLPSIFQNTKCFIDKNISMSESLYSTQQLRDHFYREKYEAVIVGSDQTWRPKYSPNIGNFFLDFIADHCIKKIAYATSFGVDNWEFDAKQTNAYRLLAQKFDAVSVRELSATTLCSEHLGISTEAVLDPTLLLDANAYDALIATQPTLGRGLYTYVLDKSEDKTALIQRISAKLGLPIYSAQAPQSIEQWTNGPVEKYRLKPVTQWLAGFKNAQFVITDSFHGMVFSILFNKPFLVVPNEGRGSARFNSLLSQLGLGDRIKNNNSEENLNLEKPCTLVTLSKLSVLREQSLKLLENNL